MFIYYTQGFIIDIGSVCWTLGNTYIKWNDMIHCCCVPYSQWCQPKGEEFIAFGRAKKRTPDLSVAAFVDLHNLFKEQTSKWPQKMVLMGQKHLA